MLDTIEGLLQPLVSRDLDVGQIADGDGTLRLVLALPSWDNYLQIGLDDFIESGSPTPMVLLRALARLSSLLSVAPSGRKPPIAWRVRSAEELAAGNFPVLWHNMTGEDRG